MDANIEPEEIKRSEKLYDAYAENPEESPLVQGEQERARVPLRRLIAQVRTLMDGVKKSPREDVRKMEGLIAGDLAGLELYEKGELTAVTFERWKAPFKRGESGSGEYLNLQSAREEIKEQYKKIAENSWAATDWERQKCLEMRDTVHLTAELVRRFRATFDALKADAGVIDYGDMEQKMLEMTKDSQICDELRGLLTYYKNIRVAVVYGGAKIEGQIKQLKAHPQIVVATPGRLMDHYKRHTISFDKVQTVVLDEADRMLDMGFFDDVTKIIEKVKNRRNLGLFSATISQEVMTVSWMYQRDEVEITVRPEAESRPDITQYSITCPPLEKIDMVSRLIRTLRLERTIVFCNTKVMCQRLRDDLVRMGLDADCIHGDIPQQKREKTMRTFKDGKLPILIATDVASRGIDVDDVDCVINYDVPEENEYYIHRIGRTGRAKKKGIAVSILGTFPEQAKLAEIAKYSHYVVQPVKFAEDGALVEEEPPKPKKAPPRRRFR